MNAKITCVYDEGSLPKTNLIGAKGFSVMVESEGKRLLFDTGLRGRYLMHNMGVLGIEPDSIDAVVVSQNHPDNRGGLDDLLCARTKPVDVYIPPGMYSGAGGFLSRKPKLSENASANAMLHDITGWFEPIPGVHISPQIEYVDGYRESFMAVRGRKLTVVSGRGHAGPTIPVAEVSSYFNRNVAAFVGSVHLEKKKKIVADAYAKAFSDNGITDINLNHAVGIDGMMNLRVQLGLPTVKDFYVGMTYEPGPSI